MLGVREGEKSRMAPRFLFWVTRRVELPSTKMGRGCSYNTHGGQLSFRLAKFEMSTRFYKWKCSVSSWTYEFGVQREIEAGNIKLGVLSIWVAFEATGLDEITKGISVGREEEWRLFLGHRWETYRKLGAIMGIGGQIKNSVCWKPGKESISRKTQWEMSSNAVGGSKTRSSRGGAHWIWQRECQW